MSLPIRPYNVLQNRQSSSMRTPQIDEQSENRSQTRIGLHGLLESMWHSSNEATRITNSEGVIVEINDAYCRFAGMRRKELIGKSFSIVYDQSTNPSRLVAKYCERFSEKSIEPLMARQIHLASGNKVFAEASNSYIKGGEGETFLLSTFRDVTERHAAEEALRTSELKFRSVTQSSVNAIVSSDSHSMITSWNDAARRIFGYEEQEILGQPVLRLMPERFRTAHQQGVGRLRSTNEPHVIGRTVELVGLRKDGKEFPIEMSLSTWDTSEGPAFGAIIRDITDRKTLESELSSAAELAKLGYWEYDVNSMNFTFSDQYFRLIHGSSTVKQGGNVMSGEEFARRLVHPDDSPLVGRALHEAIGSPDPNYTGKQEARVFRENGDIANVTVQFKALKDSSGRTYKVFGANQDVTERKKTEGALDAAYSQLTNLYNNLPEALFAVDVVQNKMLQVSPAHEAVFGYPADEFLKNPQLWNQLIVPEDRSGVAAQNSLLSAGKQVQYQFRIIDPQGKTRWIESRITPTLSGDGTLIRVDGIASDITARKLADEVLKESERKYKELFNNAVQGIFQSSVDGTLISANAALLKMLGYDSFEELASVNLADVYVNPEERRALFSRLAEEGSCSNVALLLKRKNGTVINVMEHSCAVKNASGALIAFEGILEDVTERKALEIREQEHLAALKSSQESLAELNAQKDRLFSILSHDLRSPFTSILGFCEILLDANENVSETDRNEFIRHIQNSAQQQMALLNKLLTWSRLETGRIKFDVKDVDLSAVVAASISSHLGIATQKEITLQSTLPPLLKTRGDEVMVTQVFNNLIGNALKFTPAHGLISIDLIESKNDQWMLAVRDTGAGIPKEDFRKLFKVEEKYTRVGLAGEEGTGLGLSVVHEIIKKHSGSITVQSEPGQGTTFFVQFPRLAENTEQCVLVVDDDEGVRVLHSRYLKRSFPDSQIIQAANGKEALELAKRHRPRIIVSDYSMPEMNGFEFLTRLRQEPATRETPVFVITGKDSIASMEAMRLSGAAAVLTKPVSSKQLQAVIEEYMADRI